MSSLVVAPLLLVAVLVLSGVMKLIHPDDAARAFSSLRLPAWLDHTVVQRTLPVGEIMLAVALLVTPSPWSLGFGVAAATLMVLYVVVIARALTFPYSVDCPCFGRLGLGEVTYQTLARNMLLAAVSLAGVLFVWHSSESLLQQVLRAELNDWGWLLGVMVSIVLTALIVGVGKSSAPPQEVLEDGS